MILYAVLTIVFAFSSVVYELYLAQTLTSALGGTNLRYAATIGIYITCMGLGAFIASQFSKKSPYVTLFWVEIILMLAGLLSGPFVLCVELVRADLSALPIVVQSVALADAVSLTALLSSHAPIVAIGILSGIELPLLMECSSRKKLSKAVKGSKLVASQLPHPVHAQSAAAPGGSFQSDVLAFDYLGTMFGAVCFPFLLFPSFGVFGVALFTIFCNAVGLVLFVSNEKKNFASGLPLGIALVSLFAAFLLFMNHGAISHALIEKLYIMPQSENQSN